MAAQHTGKDRLTARDMEFLAHESATTHMHVGTVTVLAGSQRAPDPAVIRQHIADFLYAVPRYRQRLAFLPGGIGHPRWIDDPVFNFDYHVRHVALPKPGRSTALDSLVSRIFSQSLDLNKPLWELYIVEGLAGKRVALIEKVHHVLVDGVRGVDLISALFDEVNVDKKTAYRWQPRPEPSAAQLFAAEFNDFFAQDFSGMVSEVSHAVFQRTNGLLKRVMRRGSDDQPSPFWAGKSSHRRFARMVVEMEVLQGIRAVEKCTVTDVILAMVSGGLRRWLHERGIRAGSTDICATVPVAIRDAQLTETRWTTITPTLVYLPIATELPAERLRAIKSTMRKKTAKISALRANEIVKLSQFAPPTILAQASREELGAPAHHLQVTNVPGPRQQPNIAAYTVEGIFPVPFLAEHHALSIAAISLGDTLHIGVTTAADAVEKPERVITALRAELKVLQQIKN